MKLIFQPSYVTAAIFKRQTRKKDFPSSRWEVSRQLKIRSEKDCHNFVKKILFWLVFFSPNVKSINCCSNVLLFLKVHKCNVETNSFSTIIFFQTFLKFKATNIYQLNFLTHMHMFYFEGASTSEELSFYLSTDYEFKACRLITKCMGACVTTYIFTCMFVCMFFT